MSTNQITAARRLQRGRPIIISNEGATITPERFLDGAFATSSTTASAKSEKWLQTLIHKHPLLLPVHDIEPGIGHPIPAAMEVCCAPGRIDNLYLTPTGNIVLAETKLWKNPQARREVVAQVLDYVATLQAMSYEAFEAAILAARGDGAKSLYDIVATPLLNEADFIDAVARNLARGRILALVVGDGIREEVHSLAGLLQSHAGSHFTLALVQINLWHDIESGTLIAVPDTLLRTVMVERGIVIFDDGIPRVVPMPVSVGVVSGNTMSSELFDEALAKRDPQLPSMLRAFIGQASGLGVYSEQRAGLHLLVNVPGYELPLKLGYITKTGQYWTENIVSAAPAAAAGLYLERLAQMIDGQVTTDAQPYAATSKGNGKSAPFVRDLLREHADGWFDIIMRFVRECEEIAAKGAPYDS